MEINKKIGLFCTGFVAEQNGNVIDSATTLKELLTKRTGALLGDKSLVVKHVVPKGMIRIY